MRDIRQAIDRFRIGSEEEVSAEGFYGAYIPQKKSRFFCPECGEPVFWKSRGGRKTSDEFSHYKGTTISPECDKRVDGRSELNLYQRVGLPVSLSCLGESQFRLYILFPAIGDKLLDTAVNASYKICISDSEHKKIFPIDRTYFLSTETTRIPIDFIPSNGANYSIQVDANTEIKQKWSDYSDGFALGGAIFAHDDTGGKKIRRGDSISPERQYYVIAQEFNSSYDEIVTKRVGSIRLTQSEYFVYTMSINVSVNDEHRYTVISNYLKSRFGVFLLETPPELIPLWPPLVEQDVLVPAKNVSTVYCAISSGNALPKVYTYWANQANPIAVHQNEDGLNMIALPLKKETIISVDRKYTGRETVFQKKSLPVSSAAYSFSIENSNGSSVNLEELRPAMFSSGLTAKSNAKMELYIGSHDKTYKHIPIRDANTLIPARRNFAEIVLAVENGVWRRYGVTKAYGVRDDEDSIYQRIVENSKGDYVPAPRWVGFLLTKWQRSGQHRLVAAVRHSLNNGNIPRGLLSILFVLVRHSNTA